VPARVPSGRQRPFWAARNCSRRRRHRPTFRESVRSFLDYLCRRWPKRNAVTSVCTSIRGMLIGFNLWPSWWRIIRYAPTRREGSGLVTGVRGISLSYWDIGPGSATHLPAARPAAASTPAITDTDAHRSRLVQLEGLASTKAAALARAAV